MGIALLICGIIALVLVVGVPATLLFLLVHHGEKSRRAERAGSRFYRRGFEVKQHTGGPPVAQKKDIDHG